MDDGISGKNITDRPAINRMIADVVQKKVENVLVFKIDRLTRNTKDLISLMDLFNENNCAFNSLIKKLYKKEIQINFFMRMTVFLK